MNALRSSENPLYKNDLIIYPLELIVTDSSWDRNAITNHPVNGVKRPSEDSNEGKTPAISDDQVRALLNTLPVDALKGKRDRAILATAAYHGLRRFEIANLLIKDMHLCKGVMHLHIRGSRGFSRDGSANAESAASTEQK